MRKIFSLALIALTMMVVSCGKKDSDDVTPNKLVGTWYLESMKRDGQAQTLTDCDKRSNITFRETEYSTMNYKLKNTNDCGLTTEEGTYTISGNVLVAKPKGKEMKSTKVSLSGGKLIFTKETDDDGKKHTSELVFVKK